MNQSDEDASLRDSKLDVKFGSPTQTLLRESPPEDTVARNSKFKHMYCGNCGKKGHTYKYCREPIISVGIIAFSISSVIIDNDSNLFSLLETKQVNAKSLREDIKFLMICRKDSFGFVEFMRGRYSMDNLSYLKQLLMEMTQEERKRIQNTDFDTLWNKLWMNETKSQFRNEYKKSKKKFEMLRDGSNRYNLRYYDGLVSKCWREPEWGFPKGRRNLREVDLDCAKREFSEETGIPDHHYTILDIPPITEEFMGTNNVRYRHIYYLAHFGEQLELKVDPDNKSQIAEVSSIGWMSLSEGLASIRPYNKEKKIALSQAYKCAENHYLAEYPSLLELCSSREKRTESARAPPPRGSESVAQGSIKNVWAI